MKGKTPDFDTIWAANSPIGLYPLTTKEILQGWNFVGATPPPRSAFDAWMNRADLKMQWMYNNMFSEDALAGFLYWRLPNTAYFAGEKVALQKEFDIYLECTTAGESSPDQMLTLPEEKKVGDALQDGTIQWVVRQKANTANIADSISGHNTDGSAHPNLTRVKSMNAKDGVLTVTTVNGSSTNEEKIPLGLNILQRKKKYDVGDIAYSPNLKSYQYLECITAGTTGDTEPAFSTVVTGGVINDGMAQFILRTIKDSAMTGDIAFRPYVALGWVKAVGETVNRADYPTLTKFADDYGLWTETPEDEPWKFGTGDGSTTMALPDYRNRVIQGGDTVGVLKAGLPNIIGTFLESSDGWPNTNKDKLSGAFSAKYPELGGWVEGGNGGGRSLITFNASKSNSIYGSSETVQPPAIVLIPQIKI